MWVVWAAFSSDLEWRFRDSIKGLSEKVKNKKATMAIFWFLVQKSCMYQHCQYQFCYQYYLYQHHYYQHNFNGMMIIVKRFDLCREVVIVINIIFSMSPLLSMLSRFWSLPRSCEEIHSSGKCTGLVIIILATHPNNYQQHFLSPHINTT